ncbi:class IIb bacteriocin, lactobin A/cerein 7B family [Flavobacterium sp. MMS24-S5]|uniref:class IIb bacteriocin, lactobin A/cerein 7B family n=1 Tax=Flavobacterium sp. MMS24-S5 TaxID=3416605 RepID=UPI003D026602
MNLEELNLVELNVQEIQEVEGGIIPLLMAICGGIYGTGYVIGRVAHHLENS